MLFRRSLLLVFALLPAVSRAEVDAVKKNAVMQHTKIIHANYEDCVAEAKKLRAALRELVAAPDAAKLDAARKAWTRARQPYLQSEAYRYYSGPIDDADGPEQLLNAWPLDEGFIEEVPGGEGQGLLGNVRDYPEITPQVLELLNQRDGEKAVACGWHAMEFLLWGQDKSATGPGARPFTDYSTAPLAARRGELLLACADLAVSQLEGLVADWTPDDINKYRAVFEEGVNVESMLSALIFLSENELAGARLQVAYDTKDQENEHSCFSDTTWQDNVYDIIGVKNVWRGTYVRIDGKKLEGPGLRDVCRAVKPELEGKISALIDGSLEKARAIPQPFDQAILGEDDAPGRKAVMALIVSLEEQALELRNLARALGIEVPDVPPEGIEG